MTDPNFKRKFCLDPLPPDPVEELRAEARRLRARGYAGRDRRLLAMAAALDAEARRLASARPI